MPRHQVPAEAQQGLATERRLQVGAALVLGLLVLVSIVLRAGIPNVFPAGWWHRW